MKKYYLPVIFTLVFLVLFFAYYSTRKEDVYISFIDINGYQYHFIDSTDVYKIEKVIITQSGEMSYERWEINVDTESIVKAELLDVVKLINNSQYWIISNYQPLGMNQKGLQKYRLHIIRLENDVPYILPISGVDIIME